MDASALIHRGNANLAEGMVNQAINAYTRAIGLAPRQACPYYRRSEAYYDRWHAIAGETPTDPEKYAEFKVRVRRSKDLDRALKDLDAAIAIDPTLAEAYYGRGAILYQKGLYREAVLSLSTAISLHEKGHYQPAVQSSFGKGLSVRDCVAHAYFQRALCHEHLDSDARSLEDLDSVTRIDPQYADAFFEKGIIYGNQGKYDLALQEIEKAIAINPRSANYHCHRGMAISIPAFESDDEEALVAALASLDEAIRLEPKYAEAYMQRSLIYGVLGNAEKEMENLSTTIKLDPDYLSAYWQRFECLMESGKRDQALQDIAQYYARSKKNARISRPCKHELNRWANRN